MPLTDVTHWKSDLWAIQFYLHANITMAHGHRKWDFVYRAQSVTFMQHMFTITIFTDQRSLPQNPLSRCIILLDLWTTAVLMLRSWSIYNPTIADCGQLFNHIICIWEDRVQSSSAIYWLKISQMSLLWQNLSTKVWLFSHFAVILISSNMVENWDVDSHNLTSMAKN